MGAYSTVTVKREDAKQKVQDMLDDNTITNTMLERVMDEYLEPQLLNCTIVEDWWND